MLRYRLEGNGATPLLLIHGWGVTYSVWQNLAPLLTPHFQLIMIELPGIGGSPEADFAIAFRGRTETIADGPTEHIEWRQLVQRVVTCPRPEWGFTPHIGPWS